MSIEPIFPLTAVEALCEEIASLQAERDALLAVVEAAQELIAMGDDQDFHSLKWDRLEDALAALHSQASDEGKA